MKKNILVLLIDSVMLIVKNPLLLLPLALYQISTFAYAFYMSGSTWEATLLDIIITILMTILAFFVVVYTALLAKNILDSNKLNSKEACFALTKESLNVLGILLITTAATAFIAYFGASLTTLLAPYMPKFIRIGFVSLIVFTPLIYLYVFLLSFSPLISVCEKMNLLEAFKKNQELVRNNIILTSSLIICGTVLSLIMKMIANSLYMQANGNLVGITTIAFISSVLLFSVLSVLWAAAYKEASKAG